MRCCFTMGIERSCLSRCDGSVFKHCCTVAGLRRMMNYPWQLPFRAAIEQSFQYERVQALATRHGERIFYCPARKLVSKSNRFAITTQHSCAHAFFEGGIIRADCVIEQ